MESINKDFSPDKENKAAFPLELAALINISCALEKEKLINTKEARIKYFILLIFNAPDASPAVTGGGVKVWVSIVTQTHIGIAILIRCCAPKVNMCC